MSSSKKAVLRKRRVKAPSDRAPGIGNTGPSIHKIRTPPKSSPVFDSYWHFAAKRQNVFFARIEHRSPPWSDDPILNTYKFTNAYRASDRVSQFLIRNVIYTEAQEPTDLFFRIVLFKLFNKIETWRLLESQLGPIRFGTYRYRDYDLVLSRALNSGARIYSAAYIMAAGSELFSVTRKHQAHLRLVELMMRDGAADRLQQCRSMAEAFNLLKSYPLVGNFLAYQLVTDLNYSELTNFSEMEFTMPGPGALDGIRKCFLSLGELSEVDAIRFMAERQEAEFERLGIQFRSLWGRRLQLIDAQNLFCEVDKYARVKHPDITGLSGRTRIKQRFSSTSEPIQYCYPPKWRLKVSLPMANQIAVPLQHRLL